MSDDTIWYMAHPVAGDAKSNAQRALRWLAWLRKQEPEAIITAPWLASLLSGDDDADPRQRERAVREGEVIAAMCDGVILVGGRISSGMQRELDICAGNGGTICDLTSLGADPPDDEQLDNAFDDEERKDPYSPPATVLELGSCRWEAS